jgi:hypothetical protein
MRTPEYPMICGGGTPNHRRGPGRGSGGGPDGEVAGGCQGNAISAGARVISREMPGTPFDRFSIQAERPLSAKALWIYSLIPAFANMVETKPSIIWAA